MSAHVALAQLSALLDGELPGAGRRRRVEEHLARCADCRRRLDGLRGVVEALSRAGRVQVPRSLDLWASGVATLAASEQARRYRERRSGATRPELVGVPLAHSLALVVGLATLLVALAATGDRHAARPVAGRTLVLHGHPAELAAVPARAGERVFRRAPGAWIEAENREIPGPARLATAVERGEILRALPELAPLLARAAVELVWRGERLRLERPG